MSNNEVRNAECGMWNVVCGGDGRQANASFHFGTRGDVCRRFIRVDVFP